MCMCVCVCVATVASAARWAGDRSTAAWREREGAASGG